MNGPANSSSQSDPGDDANDVEEWLKAFTTGSNVVKVEVGPQVILCISVVMALLAAMGLLSITRTVLRWMVST